MKKFLTKIFSLSCGCFAFIACARATCPDGYTQRILPSGAGIGSAKNSLGACVPLCDSGVSEIRTSAGHLFKLFTQSQTEHAVVVSYNNHLCYADLVTNAVNSGMNIQFGNTTYHVYDGLDYDCPVPFSLSYNCGVGTGTAPDSQTVNWGENYTLSDSVGNCTKAGYYFTGWAIDGSSRKVNTFYNWQYESNKTAVAQWSPDTFVAIYSCNYCDTTFGTTAPYTSVTYGTSFQPVAPNASGGPECVNAYNQPFLGYRLLDVWGNDTGVSVSPGGSFDWLYASGMKLRPNWGTGDANPTNNNTSYTLTYSCGSDATGGNISKTDTVTYRDLYSVSDDYGTCTRTGYYPSGWTIGTTTVKPYTFGTWNWTTNQTATINWVQDSYIAIYECNTGTPGATAYTSVLYGATFTPVAPNDTNGPECTAPTGTEFAGYDVLDARGNVLSNVPTLANGDSITWNYDQGLKFRAKWVAISE